MSPSTHDIKWGFATKVQRHAYILAEAEQTSTSEMQALVRI
jgi:hypothetical protein